MLNNSAIECIQLSKIIKKKLILKDINFNIKKGELIALTGKNGAGKTTLLKILAALITPSNGKALICGYDAITHPAVIKKIIGFVSSDGSSFYWRLTGKQNLKFFASLYKIDDKEADRRIDKLLEEIGFEKLGNICFKEYSNGMKQALGIIRSLIHNPCVLLLDEPTRGLNSEILERIWKILFDKIKKENISILMANHNLNEVEKIADRILILENGVI